MKWVVIKVCPLFKEELEQIKLEKIKNGTSDFIIGDRRLTKAIIKTSMWNDLKRILIEANIQDDRFRNGYDE